jgi:hypothetical protein
VNPFLLFTAERQNPTRPQTKCHSIQWQVPDGSRQYRGASPQIVDSDEVGTPDPKIDWVQDFEFFLIGAGVTAAPRIDFRPVISRPFLVKSFPETVEPLDRTT